MAEHFKVMQSIELFFAQHNMSRVTEFNRTCSIVENGMFVWQEYSYEHIESELIEVLPGHV